MRKLWWGIALAFVVSNANAGPIMEWNFTLLASDWFGPEGNLGTEDHRELLIGSLRYEAGTRTIKSLSARSMDQDYGFSTYSDEGYELLYDYYAPRNQYAWSYQIPVTDTAGKELNFGFAEIFVWVQSELEHATLDNRMMHYVGFLELPNSDWSDPNRQMRFIDGEFFLQREINVPAVSVPEPTSIGLAALGLAGIAFVRRRRNA